MKRKGNRWVSVKKSQTRIVGEKKKKKEKEVRVELRDTKVKAKQVESELKETLEAVDAALEKSRREQA